MHLSFDPKANVAYIRLRERVGEVETIKVTPDFLVDIDAIGMVCGVELLNPNVQLSTWEEIGATPPHWRRLHKGVNHLRIDNPRFRELARNNLHRAQMELKSGDRYRLTYAALELRLALEALTYDRALAFRKEFPPEEYKGWQPRTVIEVLKDIDPLIVESSIIGFSEEGTSGETPESRKSNSLGTDRVLTIAEIKEHYGALGSYLHTPSLKKALSEQIPDEAKFRDRCQKIAEIIQSVLNSKTYNVTLGEFTHLSECVNSECKKPIHNRIPSGADSFEAKCHSCGAEYVVTCSAGTDMLWAPKCIYAPCSNATCSEQMALWPHEIKSGTHWRCRSCGTHNGIELSVVDIEGNAK
jgi:uncharacterized protein YuzE